MVFEGREFVPMSAVAHHTPVLTVGGISKRWLVPGWRLGWLIMNDPVGVLADSSFREASVKMMQMLMGPATITQVCTYLMLWLYWDFEEGSSFLVLTRGVKRVVYKIRPSKDKSEKGKLR
jgi:aspartate/methionine/tyrosine aminotransferase